MHMQVTLMNMPSDLTQSEAAATVPTVIFGDAPEALPKGQQQ